MSTIHVLVFGATGTGKTSLCNALTGQSMPTDSGALGVTSATHCYEPVSVAGHTIHFIDTAGLHEFKEGKVPQKRAVLNLVDLIRKSEAGFSILVHVIRFSDRITEDNAADYEFFVKKMAQGKIPALLVVTGCENEHPMSAWADRNRAAYSRFKYKDIVSTCFAKGGPQESRFSRLRKQSKASLLHALVTHALPVPRRLYGKGTRSTFDQTLTRIWNQLVEAAQLGDEFRRDVNESVYDLLKRLGVPERIARSAIQHLPDVAEKILDSTHIPYAGKVGKWITKTVLSRFVSPKEGK